MDTEEGKGRRRRRGRLLLIGGNEDMDERDMRILFSSATQAVPRRVS
jgi:hypothetical protein